jgi:alpha-L-rhamnosidase
MGTYTDAEGHSTVLLEDGPGVADFSVHPQVFAVLTGLVTPEEGRKMLEATVGNPDMAQSSVSYMFYLFRALEMTGWYEKTDELWNLWRKMVREHMSTCVENGTDSRSDCHAWSALMLYELPCAVLGVTPAAPGFRKMNIHPHAGALKSAKGDVITPVGNVHVEWSLDSDGEMKLSYQAPDEVEVLSPES